MKPNQKLAYAISVALSGYAGASYGATAAESADTSDSIQEIVVTAQRRSESIQDVPITIQAITGDTLKQLSVENFDSLLKYTPNVTFASNGPGQGNIFIRGLSGGATPGQSQSTIAPFPNVGLYLDDQPVQFPNHNLDVYLVDMERVEILEGPQGTLFGSGAEAGAVRYITNKPKLNVTEGTVNAGYGWTGNGGNPNGYGNATLNLPLLTDHLAFRATVFSDNHGGYISNVPGTISYVNKTGVQSPIASNGALVQSNTNPLSYTGMRLQLLYQVNDNWDVLLQQNNQSMNADGYFAAYPNAPDGTPLGKYQIIAFTPAYNTDKYESTSWTVNGKLPYDMKLVYTGSYLTRDIDQQADYSNYLTSASGQSYACTGKGANYFKSAKPTTCYAPVGNWNDSVRNTNNTEEIRLATNEAYRLRAVVGGFWEKFVINDNMNFNYLPIPQCNEANLSISLAGGPDCVSAIGPIPGNFASDPGLRLGTNTAFGEDVQRGYVQTAGFLSVDFDILHNLTITGGTRYYNYDEFETGSEYSSEHHAALNSPNGACTAAEICGFGINLKKSESGFRSRGNLTWKITPDYMAYYTWSQGFRPGGFNRTNSSADGTVVLQSIAPYSATIPNTNQYNKPVGYSSDTLTNNEVGFKSEFLNHRVLANVSLYQEQWDNVQLGLFDPKNLGNTTFVVNGPSYRVRGIELQLTGRITTGLTLTGSAVWNSSDQTDAPCLASVGNTAAPGNKNNPTPAGQCITTIKGNPYTNPFGELGTTPAYSPDFEFNVRLRYDWNFGDYHPYAQIGANHIGTMASQPANFPAGGSATCGVPVPTLTLCKYIMPGYTTYDASLGVAKDNWNAFVSGTNLTNVYASTTTSSGQYIEQIIPIRPQVIMLNFGYKF